MSDVLGIDIARLISHEYTYLFTDLRTNKIIGELPLQNVSYKTVLSGFGDFSGSISLNYETSQMDVKTATEPGRVGLYVLRDNSVQWGGIVWKRQYSGRERKLTITGATFESYFYHRLQLQNKYWANEDQLEIARWLVQSSGAAAAIGVDVSPATSPHRRERTMFGYEFKTVGLELEQLSNLIDGFDWNIQVYRDTNDTFKRSLQFYYPAAGQARDTTQLFFEYPGSIVDFTLSEDAENSGMSLWAIGAGEGSEQVQANSQDNVQIAAGWPILEITRSYKSVYYISTLQAHADADLKRLKTAVAVFEVSVSPDIYPELGTYSLGDWARFKMQDGFLNPAFDAYARITEIAVTVDGSTGLETVALTLGGDEVDTDAGNDDEEDI